MRPILRHSRRINRRFRRSIRRGLRRSVRRSCRHGGGRLLGMAGLAALGYTLLEKNRREQERMVNDPYVNWEEAPPDPNSGTW